MYSAPSVSYPVGRSFFYAFLAAGAWLLTGAVAGAWVVQVSPSADLGLRQGVMLVLWLLCGVALGWGWRTAPRGLLRWDGRQWWWTPEAGGVAADGLPWALSVHLDLQRVLLARLRQSGRVMPLWLWLERGQQVSGWHALRCAVFSRAGEASP